MHLGVQLNKIQILDLTACLALNLHRLSGVIQMGVTASP